MALLRLTDVSVAFGDAPVLDGLSVAVNAGDRAALVGRNGTGKSTLLKVLAGLISVDSGERTAQKDIRLAYLEQSVPRALEGTVFSVVADGLAGAGQRLARYMALGEELSVCTDKSRQGKIEKQLADLQEAIDAENGWTVQTRVDEVLTRMSLDGDALLEQLSGGLKRRVLLARALLQEPHVLFLDEPTNHLDIESVRWLETHLAELRCALMFVTHDRTFLQAMANRILDLDRGNLTDWPGSYEKFLKGKAELLHEESRRDALFDKRLAEEETWIRQGIKARRTRNEGRVRALKKLREERAGRREREGTANLTVNQAGRSGKKVITAEAISFSYPDQDLIREFDTTLMRGDKVAIIGPNGVGKSTLVNILLGKITPTSGTVEHGTNLKIAYFDQLRTTLRPELSAQDNVSGGKDMIEVQGNERHIIGYMKEFLFSPERARAPITALSGGETSRLMLAKLFLQPSNVLVLDEPTNDLDIETLELLEGLLVQYEGTVMVISHDRTFIDNVVTSTIVFGKNGRLQEFVGGYSEWHDKHAPQSGSASSRGASGNQSMHSAGKQSAKATQDKASQETPAKTEKLSYKLQRELDALPEKIANLEEEIASIEAKVSAPDFYSGSAGGGADNEAQRTLDRLTEANKELETAYSRWDELESQSASHQK